MAEYGVARREPSSWAVGFTAFAAFMLWIIGLFHAITGLTALMQGKFFVTTPNYIFSFNVATWGWVHLIVGIIIFLAGIGVLSGAVWARTVGVIVALLSAIANFAFLPYYPVWAILIIAVDVAVIWALTAHGRDITEDMEAT